MILLFMVWAGVAFGSGCGTATESQRSSWVRKHGGLADDRWQGRIGVGGAQLVADSIDSPVAVRVLASDAVCAYSWPDGQVFVTRGLVEVLNEDELAAAVAHEVGHLLDGEHAVPVVSLQGVRGSTDSEERADAMGVQLLERQGIGPAAMSMMLTKVLGSCSDRARREALGRRIRRRDAALGAASPAR